MYRCVTWRGDMHVSVSVCVSLVSIVVRPVQMQLSRLVGTVCVLLLFLMCGNLVDDVLDPTSGAPACGVLSLLGRMIKLICWGCRCSASTSAGGAMCMLRAHVMHRLYRVCPIVLPLFVVKSLLSLAWLMARGVRRVFLTHAPGLATVL